MHMESWHIQRRGGRLTQSGNVGNVSRIPHYAGFVRTLQSVAHIAGPFRWMSAVASATIRNDSHICCCDRRAAGPSPFSRSTCQGRERLLCVTAHVDRCKGCTVMYSVRIARVSFAHVVNLPARWHAQVCMRPRAATAPALWPRAAFVLYYMCTCLNSSSLVVRLRTTHGRVRYVMPFGATRTLV